MISDLFSKKKTQDLFVISTSVFKTGSDIKPLRVMVQLVEPVEPYKRIKA